jgi:Secretion system C-terminal sorting domain
MVVNGIIYDFQSLSANQQPGNIVTRTKLDDQGWQKVGVRFKAPLNAPNSVITIYNFQQGGYGNDFAVDDIFFSEVTNPLAFSGSTMGVCGSSLTVLTTATAPCQQFGSPVYQWEVSTNSGVSYSNEGSTFTNLPNTVSAVNTSSNIRYRLRITDGSCVNTTNAVQFNNIANYCTLPFDGFTLTGQLKNNLPELKWKVNDEKSVTRYELERSMDGNVFSYVATVNANGLTEYNFYDARNTGEMYYRVKVILENNQAKFSSVLRLKGYSSGSSLALDVNPNPVKEMASINLKMPYDGECILRVMDINGRVVKAQTFRLKKGVNAFTMDGFKGLMPGIYLVEAIYNSERQTKRISVVQ